MEIAHEVDQMHVSGWCLDVWEGATHVHTLMSSSHTALLLYLPPLLPLFTYCACPSPVICFYSYKYISFTGAVSRSLTSQLFLFKLNEIKELKSALPLFPSPAGGKHTSG